MFPLTAYVESLRAQDRGLVPDFDSRDGGVDARLLLLLEKPGPRPPGLGAGFVSRDNPTPTAACIRAGMAAAGVPREGTIIWNAVPWWNGTMRVYAAEKRAGADELQGLLALLPRLRSVVLAGSVAQAVASPVFKERHVEVFRCVHPSPNARAGPASSEAWRRLPEIWRAAWDAASAP